MLISEIYQKYQIMPQLQLHMQRVASVAWQICDNSNTVVDVDNIISACLLHDMGNILKFKLELFPEFLKPQGLEYWENVKSSFQKKYGTDEHDATNKIIKELNVSTRVFELVTNFGYANFQKVFETNDMPIKICTYSDHRVSPFGVRPLIEKIIEGNKRFRINKPGKHDQKFFEKMEDFAQKTEEQIFAQNKIDESEINDQSIQFYLDKIINFNIKLS